MDEVWYDSGTHHYYTASRGQPGGAVLGVIDAKTNKWIENVPTAPGAHSVAAEFEDQARLRPAHRKPELPQELHRRLRREVIDGPDNCGGASCGAPLVRMPRGRPRGPPLRILRS